MTLTLETLQKKIKEWQGCALAKTANAVLGEGNPHARVMFIGEAPGQREDELGRPFVGPAGEFLNQLLSSIGLKREEVYISNVVKYRPPGNREPTPEEKEQCLPWLKLEIALIQPRVLVPLGRHALGHFFPKHSITKVHGEAHTLRPSTRPTRRPRRAKLGVTSAQGDTPSITIFPIYHPAAALHNGGLRSALEEDFRKLGEFLKSTV